MYQFKKVQRNDIYHLEWQIFLKRVIAKTYVVFKLLIDLEQKFFNKV